MQIDSLYARLGGSTGINELVEDIVDRHMENPTIQARFRPILEDPDKLSVTKQHLCTFLEAGSGGPAEYTGRSMPEAHRGMNISAGEYMAAVDDIMDALQAHDIDEQTQKDVLAIAFQIKDGIIRV